MADEINYFPNRYWPDDYWPNDYWPEPGLTGPGLTIAGRKIRFRTNTADTPATVIELYPDRSTVLFGDLLFNAETTITISKFSTDGTLSSNSDNYLVTEKAIKTRIDAIDLQEVTSTGSITSVQIVSTVATGTSPFQIASTTVTNNLNADLLDGQHGSFYSSTGHVHDVISPRRISQSSQPTPAVGELILWRDTDDDRTYLLYNDVDVGIRSIELT